MASLRNALAQWPIVGLTSASNATRNFFDPRPPNDSFLAIKMNQEEVCIDSFAPSVESHDIFFLFDVCVKQKVHKELSARLVATVNNANQDNVDEALRDLIKVLRNEGQSSDVIFKVGCSRNSVFSVEGFA